MLGVQFLPHPGAFLQVNTEIATDIYRQVASVLQSHSIVKVIDAYSGIGILSAHIAKQGMETTAIEIVQEAHALAEQIKKDNQLDNLKNLCGDTGETIPKLLQQNQEPHIAVLLDPPRKGCDTLTLDAINQHKPALVIYISCNPSTLARDLSLLHQYTIQSITPYDMFAHTKHIECVAVLQVSDR